MEIDPWEPAPWEGGLHRLADDAATCTVTVDGLDRLVTGTLTVVDDGSGMMVVGYQGDGTWGEVVWVPWSRVVAVAATFAVREDDDAG